MRVTQMTFYRQSLYDMMRQTEAQFDINNHISSGTRIAVPSDDPLDSIWTQDTHRTQEAVIQYKTNVGHAKDWLQMAEGQMSAMVERLTRAKELAEQMSTGTYSAEQRELAASDAEAIISQLLALGNSDLSGNYIFAGTRTRTQPSTEQMRAENPAPRVDGDLSLGKLYGQGDYTGMLSRDITFTVSAGYPGGVPAAANPMTLDYEYYDDDGVLVTGTTAAILGTGSGFAVDVADGVAVRAEDLDYADGDQFILREGRLQGNEEAIDVNLSKTNRMTYNYTLEQLWGQEGFHDGEFTNIIDQLTDWKDALANDVIDGEGQETSQELLPKLVTAMSRLLNYQADAGSKLNRLEVRTNLLGDEYLRLDDRLVRLEDTDITEAIIGLKTYQVLYQATLQAVSLVSSRNLSDYL